MRPYIQDEKTGKLKPAQALGNLKLQGLDETESSKKQANK